MVPCNINANQSVSRASVYNNVPMYYLFIRIHLFHTFVFVRFDVTVSTLYIFSVGIIYYIQIYI